MTVRTIDEIFRDFVTDGVPASGPFNPHKPDIRDTLKALTEGGETFPDNRVIRLNNANEGTENNIVVTASVAIPAAAYQVLYILNVTQENTGPVTVSGAINRDLVTNINQPIAPGYLIPGMALLCIDTGTELRLLSYGDAEAILAAAEDAAARAEAAAAGLNLPSTGTGDKGKALLVNSDATGYTLGFVEITVDTRSDLKALPVFFKTAYLLEAGREGTFVLKAGSPPVADTQEGVYVVSNTAGYYWERVYVGAASAKWFGAKGDGVTNDTTAIQASLDVCGNVILPYTSEGYLAGGINLTSGMSLRGEDGKYSGPDSTIFAPRKSCIKIAAASAYGVKINSFIAGNYTRLGNIQFDGGTTSATAVRLGLATLTVYGVRLNDISFIRCVEAIGDEVPKDSTTWVHDLEVRGMYSGLTRGRQIYLRQSNGFILFRDVKIENTHNAAQVTWETARFDNIAGLELDRFDIIGSGPFPMTYNPSVISLVISGGPGLDASVWLNRVLVDSTCGQGIVISGVYNVVSEATGVHLTFGASLSLINVTKSRFSKTSVFGAKGMTNAPASAEGIRLDGSSDCQFSETYVENCTGNGITLNNSLRNSFHQTTTRDNTGTGFYEAGTSDRNINAGLYSFGNATGSLIQVGASSATVNWVPNSGGFVASTLGAVTIA